jgi:hypothetical protein
MLVAHLAQDGLDGAFVHRLAGKGAVQVDQVQAPRAGIEPAPGHGGRVFAEGGRCVHVALLKAHALAVLQVDGGNQQHGSVVERGGDGVRASPGRKLRYSSRPCSALFSGWNWVAKMLSRATRR